MNFQVKNIQSIINQDNKHSNIIVIQNRVLFFAYEQTRGKTIIYL